MIDAKFLYEIQITAVKLQICMIVFEAIQEGLCIEEQKTMDKLGEGINSK